MRWLRFSNSNEIRVWAAIHLAVCCFLQMTDTYPSPVSQECCHSDGVPCLPISGGGGLARLLIAVKWPLSRPCCWTSGCRRHRSELIAASAPEDRYAPPPPPTRAYLFRAFSHVNQAKQYLAGHAGQARRSRWRDRDSPGGWLKVFHSLVAVVFLMPPLIDRLMSVWWRSEDSAGGGGERARGRDTINWCVKDQPWIFSRSFVGRQGLQFVGRQEHNQERCVHWYFWHGFGILTDYF